MKIPPVAAAVMRMQLAGQQQQRAMAASGLPECAEGTRLAERWSEAAVATLDGDGVSDEAEAAHAALEGHAASCRLCRARQEYSERHAPPMPRFSDGPFLGAVNLLFGLVERLPGPLRAPAGGRGDGRRIGAGMAAMFASMALVPAVVMLVVSLFRRPPLAVVGEAAALLAFLVAYVATGFLCGWAWDVLHPFRGRFLGYLLRGALVPAVAFAAFGAMIAFMPGDEALEAAFIVPVLVAPLGAIAGAILWVWHRVRGKLPRRRARGASA